MKHVRVAPLEAAPVAPPAYWALSAEAVAAVLGGSVHGLTQAEAETRLARDGPNSVRDDDDAGVVRLMWRQFSSPLVLILVFAAMVALVLREWTEASIILVIVLSSTALGFFQEWHASRAVAALRARLALTTKVWRDGVLTEAPASALVRGDVIVLSAGNLAPADALLLDARDFLVTEASLTGESFPVEKRVGAVAAGAPVAERSNCVFAGSSVRSGQATMLVYAAGRETMLGEVAARLNTRAPETEFARGLKRFGYLLLRVMIVLVLFVLIINQLLGRPFFESLLFSIALAVGLSPELLPAIVSVTLAAGARAMARRGVLVRRLEAIESLGGVDVLCTDKTGTLTEGCAALAGSLDANGVPSQRVMHLAFANAAFETGIANPLDEAIVAAANAQGLAAPAWRKIDEIPYDFQRKRLTIVVDDGAADTRLLISKGAFKEIMAVCATRAGADGTDALDAQNRTAIDAAYESFGAAGIRSLGIASRRVPVRDRYDREDEADLVFEGFLNFADPPKADARQAMVDLAAAGVKVKIITGDNRFVAAHVAAAMGLGAARMMRGDEIAAVRNEALGPLVDAADLFAEVDPQQKERIVRALQRQGHAVAFLGDGVNDAPSLHAADVGISVQGAVDVAREAADVILLERDLGVLKQGIEDGRRTFTNTLKYICITTGSSFGNMVTMALATPLLPFLPLTATQVLLTNLLTDLPLMAVTTDNVDPEHVARPQRWSVRDIQRFMLVFGLVSSLFDFATFWLLLNVFHAGETLFQTAWFVVSVLTELAALWVLRTRRPFWTSVPSRWIIGFSIAVATFVLAAPMLPVFAGWFTFAPLPPVILAAGLVIAAGYAGATELAKRFFYRRAAGAV